MLVRSRMVELAIQHILVVNIPMVESNRKDSGGMNRHPEDPRAHSDSDYSGKPEGSRDGLQTAPRRPRRSKKKPTDFGSNSCCCVDGLVVNGNFQ